MRLASSDRQIKKPVGDLDCHGQRRAKYCGMKFTKNIGMVLLAVYLIIDGLLGFGLNLGPFVFLLYLVALAAGVLILIGR